MFENKKGVNMPSELADLSALSTSSFFSERQVGFWKTDGMPDNRVYNVPSGLKEDGQVFAVGDDSLASLPPEKRMSSDSYMLKHFGVLTPHPNQDHKVQTMLENHALGAGRTDSHSFRKPLDNDIGNKPDVHLDQTSYFTAGNKFNVMDDHYKNGRFSSSLSELFSRKLRFSAHDALYGHSVGTAASHYEEEEPFESLEEIEAQTIGNLLPDDDDLLSGVTDGLNYAVQPGNGGDVEDYDFFSSLGGMELGEDGGQGNSEIASHLGPSGAMMVGEHPRGDYPSRTLFVRNIDSNVEDSELRLLFEQYGDVRTLYTACKHRGFVMVSYYDIQAAQKAMNTLQNKPLRRRKLDIHYSIPKDYPGSQVLDTKLQHGIASSVSNSLPSISRVEACGTPANVFESNQLQNELKYDFRSITNYHPHSLPEYQGGLANSFFCNSPSTMAASISDQKSERMENGQFSRTGGSNGSLLGLNDSVFGPSGNASCPPVAHHYMWNTSHQPQPHNMMWPNSPSLINGVGNDHSSPRLHSLPRGTSHTFSTLLPINTQHVGSAPSIWDRRQSYAGESPDTSIFHPGSLGNMNISGNSPHPLDLVSHNMFSLMSGTCMDLPIPSKSVGLASHHQNCIPFPSRGQVIPMMSSFNSPGDRASSRRNEGSSNQAENKKQFELDLDRIAQGEDKRTTLMIKNIPNKYTSKMLLAAIDEHHRGTYDFIYLPIDFKNKCNVGYAFINMTDPSHIIPFYQTFNGKKWEKFNSEKVASIAYARIQGKAALIAHFQNSSLMNEDKRCRPILFHTDGPNAGDQVPFPMGVNVRSRPNKNRNNTNEESQQDMGNGEMSSNGESSSGSTKDFE